MDTTMQTTGYQDPADEKNAPLSETAPAFWPDMSTRQDSKGGKNFAGLRNFLATDEVPESIFGIPVVQDESQYTEKDIEFFRKNPRAAGFYDLGDEDADGDVPPSEEPPPDGRPVQGDLRGGIARRFKETGEVLSDLYEMSGLKKRVGEAGEVADAGLAWAERQAKQTADMDLPVLSKYADAVAQPVLVGMRAAIANVASGGGKNYQPEVRDERYFSKASLRQLGQAVRKNGGRGTSRDDFDLGTAAGFGVANTVGGSTVVSGRLTDKFDVDAHDPYGMTEVAGKPLVLSHRALGAVVGSGDDPDAGKIRTSIPLAALDLQQDAKGGETFDTPIPEELKARYDTWYAQLPKNLQYTGDYDLQGAWLERLGQPDKYEAAQNGHLDDYGKKPNHITFSTGSKWHDPNVPERTGGEWRQAKDGSWDFYPGTGNKASDDELKAYFDKYEKGNRVHGRNAAKDVRGLLRTFKSHVKAHESRKTEPYKDVDGNWAIGYGSHFLADGTPVTRNTAATDEMIDAAFEKDLDRRLDLLAGHDEKQSRYAIPNWRHMSPASKLMLLDVAWGRKTTLTKEKSPGLFKELEGAGDDTAALDDAVKRHYLSYRKARDSKGVVDESLTEGLQNRRIALLKALTGEDFSYEGKKWDARQNRFVEE